VFACSLKVKGRPHSVSALGRDNVSSFISRSIFYLLFSLCMILSNPSTEMRAVNCECVAYVAVPGTMNVLFDQFLRRTSNAFFLKRYPD